MHNRAILAVSLLTIMIAACGAAPQSEVVEQIVVRNPGDPAAPSSAAAGAVAGSIVALGEDAFQMCSGCHVNAAGAPSSAGPNLYGVIGRTAGTLENYPYSDAMAASGIIWDESTLDGYLADPAAYLPGNDMLAGAVPDGETRAAIIAYLASNAPVASSKAGE